jgi:NAD(P)-dependent dehydrogenase (short-subunit alcohol dehydrogenase family)
LQFLLPDTVAKHGLVGFARCLAVEVGNQTVRVNGIHPTGVDTPMSAASAELPRLLDALPEVRGMFQNTLPIEVLQPSDISDAVAFFASDESRFITGACIPVDAGTTSR